MPDGSKLPASEKARVKRAPAARAKAPRARKSPYGGLRGTVLYCADLTKPTHGAWAALKKPRRSA